MITNTSVVDMRVCIACSLSSTSVNEHCVVFLSRSSCGHSQRLPEPAVWLQSLLSLRRVTWPSNALLKMSRLIFIALYPGNIICCILCHLKMFLDETVILLLLFPFPSILNVNNPLEKKGGDKGFEDSVNVHHGSFVLVLKM